MNKMKISVISARNGTGKTLVATSLALSLRDSKPSLQFMDCSVEKPDAYQFLKPSFDRIEPVSVLVPKLVKNRCTYCGKCGKVCAYSAIMTFAKNVLTFPELCRGCGACSYFCSSQALVEEKREIGVLEMGHAGEMQFAHGRLSPGEVLSLPLINKVRDQQISDGIVIVDAPSGASTQMVRAIEGSDYALLVAAPDTTGNQPLNRVTETLKRLGIPCGVVLNFSGVGDREIEEYCEIKEIPILFSIHSDIEIAQKYSRGITLAADRMDWQNHFVCLFKKITEIVSERNSSTSR